jgi:hypothetical protein
MLKRVLIFAVVAVGLFSMRSSDAKAHLAGTVYKPTYRHIASYDCTGTFAQVPSLDQHAAGFECVAVVQSFQVVCQNPQGRIVAGIPSAGMTVTQFASSLFTLADLTDKEKGKAKKTLPLPNTVLDAGNALCAERNRNWTAADELVLTVDVWLRTFDCGNETCSVKEPASESKLHCTVPPQYSLPDNPPPGTPQTPIPTDYDCTVVAESHCDQGDPCPIP